MPEISNRMVFVNGKHPRNRFEKEAKGNSEMAYWWKAPYTVPLLFIYFH